MADGRPFKGAKMGGLISLEIGLIIRRDSDKVMTNLFIYLFSAIYTPLIKTKRTKTMINIFYLNHTNIYVILKHLILEENTKIY